MHDMKNPLKLLLELYFLELEKNKIQYCVIGNYEELPEYTENDVDFWVDDIQSSEKILFLLAKEVGLKLYMVNKTAIGSNNYFYCVINDVLTIVKIDLMTETAYKSIFTIVTSKQIRDSRDKFKNFYVANFEIEGVMHLLYPLVHQGKCKEKYKAKLEKLIQNDLFCKKLEGSIGKQLAAEIKGYIKVGNWDKVDGLSTKVKREVIKRTFGSFSLGKLLKYVKYTHSLLSKLFTKNGVVIGFTGIDGAGKTSIKEYLFDNSDKYFTKNRKAQFYWRPFWLPRVATLLGSRGQKEVYDDAGKRKVKKDQTFFIKSYIKYFLYIVDFVIGQVKYFKVIHTGGFVVFDRYHFDNIIYPERFGFTVNKKIMRFIDKYFIPQPDVLFYFSANTETLYERKHEIDIDEINNQKMLYAEEMAYNKSVVLISTDGTFDSSVNDVLERCLECMSTRYL
jgi:thymidylate kinase